MKDDNCIFCKLAAGDIPTNTVYEDDTFRVIMDANPATKGHSLIIPKDHFANLYEMDEEVAAKAMKLAKKMAVHMKEKLNCDGFNLLQNNEETAGQTVFHFHMHLIPRYKGDKNDDILKYTPLELSDDEMKEILDMIKDKIKRKNKGVKSYIESGLYTFCTYAFFFFFSLASSMSLRMV